MNNARKMTLRVFFYVLGQLILAFAIALMINCGLGISPNSSLPFVLSVVLNAKMGTCITAVSIVQVLLQLVLLRRDFKLQNLLQLAAGVLLGYCTDFAKWALGDFCIPTYPGQLFMLMSSILLIGIGISFCIDASLIPPPIDGLNLAMAKTFKIPFPDAKNIQDIATVLISVLLGWLALNEVIGVREGTILSALLAGRAVKLMQRWIKPMVDKLCF